MSIHLQPMPPSDYQIWLENHVNNYASDKVQAKQCSPEEAVALARKETEKLLFAGLQTPDHTLCHIVSNATNETVGGLWWYITERFGRRVAFIFDIYIHQAHQRKGYATAALKHLEERVKKDKVEAISLHVFGFNKSAFGLYEKLGYTTTSLRMTREL